MKEKYKNTILSPMQFLLSLWHYTEIRYKVTFFSTLIVGLLAHLYMFTNKLPNYDDVRTLNGFGGSGGSGRWGLAQIGNLVTDLGLCYSNPLLNGILSVMLIATAACFIIEIFDVKDCFICGLIGSIMIVFPAWTCTFFFMFTSVFYSGAILMGVLAVYFTTKGSWGWGIGVLFLVGSLSIYQAYFPFAAALMVVKLITMCLDSSENIKTILSMMLKSFMSLMITFVLYILLTKFYCYYTGQELYDYKGINTLGISNLENLFNLGLLTSIYSKFSTLFINNTLEMSYYPTVRMMNCIMAIILIFQVLYLLIQNKINNFKKIICIMFLLIFPLVLLAIYMMCPDESAVYSIMLYPVVSIYIIVFVICEKFFHFVVFDKRVILGGIHIWVTSICGVITIFFFVHYANSQYLAMDFTVRQAQSYYTTMVSSIKNTEGYKNNYEVIFVGKEITDASFYENERMADFNTTGRDRTFLNLYCRDFFMREYCGFNVFVEEFDVEDFRIKEYKNEIALMNCYPDDGSIKIIDEIVFVRLE